MEKYDIEVLEKADEDMQRLGRYIAEELQSPMAAERITDKIWDEIERLAKNPYIYQVYIPLSPLKHEYRKVLVGSYHIFYYVNEAEKKIIISRVVYARRDIFQMMSEEDLAEAKKNIKEGNTNR